MKPKEQTLYETLKANCIEGFTREWSARTDKFREIMGKVVSEYEKATSANLPADVEKFVAEVGAHLDEDFDSSKCELSEIARVARVARSDSRAMLGIIRKQGAENAEPRNRLAKLESAAAKLHAAPFDHEAWHELGALLPKKEGA